MNNEKILELLQDTNFMEKVLEAATEKKKLKKYLLKKE